MTRFFMSVEEAVQLVLQASVLSEGGEIFMLEMGVPVKIIDLAERMIRLSGCQVGIDIPIEITGMRPGEKLNEVLEHARRGDPRHQPPLHQPAGADPGTGRGVRRRARGAGAGHRCAATRTRCGPCCSPPACRDDAVGRRPAAMVPRRSTPARRPASPSSGRSSPTPRPISTCGAW